MYSSEKLSLNAKRALNRAQAEAKRSQLWRGRQVRNEPNPTDEGDVEDWAERQEGYLSRLADHMDSDVVASEEMWR